MSVLKVNTIEKYSGSSGVTVKDSVTIAPDSGVKNLVVSGSITAETSLTSVGNIATQGNITGDNGTNITGINQVEAASATIAGSLNCGTLTVGGNASIAPWKAMGGFTYSAATNNGGTISSRICEYNIDTVAAEYLYSSGTPDTYYYRVSVTFDTALTNTNYLVFTQSEQNVGGYPAGLYSIGRYTWGFRLGYKSTAYNVNFGAFSYLVLSI